MRDRLGSRRRAAVQVLGIVLALVAAVPAVAGAVAAKRDFFGVNTFDQLTRSEEDAAIEQMGLHNVRNNITYSIGALYSCSSPEAERPDFSRSDAQIREAAAHNITLLADFNGISGTGCAVNQFPRYGTALYTAYLRFVRYAVKRYGYSGEFWREPYFNEHKATPHPIRIWEVWNEPNWTVNNPGGTLVQPQNYAKFLIDVAATIRTAQRELQSLETTNTVVLMGGLSQARRDVLPAREYLESMYLVSGNNYGPGELKAAFDGLSYHPYRLAGGPEDVENEIRYARTALEVFGDPGRTLWLTEIGWSVMTTTNEPVRTITESDQAENLRRTFRWIYENADALNVKYAAWFVYQDEAGPGTTTNAEGLVTCNRWECWERVTGLRRSNGSARPSWCGYSHFIGSNLCLYVPPGGFTTETFETVTQTLNGQPGYVSVDGHVYVNNVEGQPAEGVYVNVNFQKWENGSWVTKSTAHPVVTNGYYQVRFWGVGAGLWRTRTVLPAQAEYDESMSGYHEFQIKRGYRLVSRNSNKCLSLSANNGTNGTPIIQWDCSPAPSPGDGQVITLVPMDEAGQYFEIKINSSGKCVDVTGVSYENGARLQEWDCLGAGQANQLWDPTPISGQLPYEAFIAKHSGKCMDVPGLSTANGTQLQQWDCWWGGNQQWYWQAIE